MATSMDAYFTDLPKKQLEKALDIAQQEEIKAVIPFLEFSIGKVFISLDIIDSAKVYLKLAEAKLDKTSQIAKLTETYLELSWVYLLIPRYDLSLDYGLKALEGYRQLGDDFQTAYMLSELGFIYIITQDYDAALPFLEEALPYFEKAGDPENLGYLYDRLQMYYTETSVFNSALEYAEKAISEMDKLADKSFLSGVLISRGLLYKKNGEFDKAERDFLEAKVYAVASGYLINDIEADRELGGLYVFSKQYDKAIPVLEKIVKQYQTEGNKLIGDYIELYQGLATAYAEANNYEKAYFYQGQQEILEDSIYTLASDRNMAEMQTKYEIDRKEALLAQQRQQLYFYLGILALLLVMAAVLWWAYTGKRKQNLLLEKSNEEKAFLIKEIHHRVKNNLQVLSSLLNLQSDYIQDPNALDVVLEGRNRVQSMGLIHQKLYMGSQLSTVEMKEYIPDLTEHLLVSFGMDDKIQLSIESDIPPLDVDTAIPLGLIINELVTNSLKYAFPDGQQGLIKIQLWIDDKQDLCLKLSDNGDGISESVHTAQSTSFGLDLVKILSKKLKGKISMDTSQGYTTLIEFQRYNKSLR
ncbi:MAG: hypothetical protein Sapg2KO_26550 [Saprospiraceae bacterium]